MIKNKAKIPIDAKSPVFPCIRKQKTNNNGVIIIDAPAEREPTKRPAE